MKLKEESEKAGVKLNIQKTKILAAGPISSWQIDRQRVETVTTVMKSEDICYLEEKLWKTQHIKKRRHHFAKKGLHGQSYGFSSSQVWTWVLKNGYFWMPVLEKMLENPLDSREIKPSNPKGSQSWTFIGRTDAEAEVPIPWPPDMKSRLIGKDFDAGKDWGQKKRAAENIIW